MKPMLATSIDPENIEPYLTDPNWVATQKLDGQRLLVAYDGKTVVGYNRNGQTAVHPSIRAVFTSEMAQFAPMCLDGEILGNEYHVFDVPQLGTIISSESPHKQRREIVRSFVGLLPKPIRAIPSVTSSEAKIGLLKWCIEERTEGIVLKHDESSYRPGIRSDKWLKVKLVKTCDAVVASLGIDGKRNAEMFVYENGKPVTVCTVSMIDHRYAHIKPGDILEIIYLYASNDRRLVQPRVLRQRTDKPAEQCDITQLVFTNKEIIFTEG